ncbi:hypothetical protein C5167_041108 [Papaver somniferum]|uniref:PGG domain-containing protein n=1 Tax=Papaver somniferum TaxID=3469 RepID=A0A4Y7IJA0_PAPSO|nr:uncharacterized protein LOC113322359 [Papaver somniferum]RZC48166.1 hypothetical protein C5167_041108 [Papaver somniferum]
MEKVLVYFRKKFSSKDSRLDNLDEVFTSFCRTPLHKAVMRGDIEHAEKILSLKPDLALKEDTQGFTPLHLASARTSLQMVKLLLKARPAACLVQDQDGRTPLHLAAMKNRVEIIKVLMEEGLPESIHLKNRQNGDTILHFCVKSDTNLKTLKLLVHYLVLAQPPYPNSISINSTDNDGNTVLHLAAATRNMKIVKYLLENNKIRIEVNAVNNKNFKALNILPQAEKNDLEIGFYDYLGRRKKHKNNKSSEHGNDHEWWKERVNALLVVATLIAGIAFQAAINPPGGILQDDDKVDSGNEPVTFTYYLDRMFRTRMAMDLDDYINKHLHLNPSTGRPIKLHVNSSTGRSIKVKKFVTELRDIITNEVNEPDDDRDYQMADQGLILEDSEFTDIVSFYNNSDGVNGSFPYLVRYAGYPIMAYRDPDKYVVYMATNLVAFFVSLAIILWIICGFVNDPSLAEVQILVWLMCISIGCIAFAYFVVIDSVMPTFYVRGTLSTISTIYFTICCVCGIVLFLWTLISRIVKLQKRHLIGVDYLKALFRVKASSAIGKLIFFAVAIFGFYSLRLAVPFLFNFLVV